MFFVVAAIHAAPTPRAVLSHIAANSPVQLTPPAGWSPEMIPHSNYPGRKAVYQWLSYSRGDEEYVELSQRYFPEMSTADYARFYRSQILASGQKLYADRAITLCNGEQGWYMRGAYPTSTYYPNGAHTVSYQGIEVVFITENGYSYVAEYAYPSKLTPSDAAEKSIRTLCLKTPPRPIVVHLPMSFSAPRGWVTVPLTASTAPYPGMLVLYGDPSSLPPKQMIAIGEEPVDASSDTSDTAEDTKSAGKPNGTMKNLATLEVSACGTRAYFQTYVETSEGTTMQAEQVEFVSSGGDKVYYATYVRPPNTPESPKARAALTTFCPLPSAPGPQSTQTQTPAPVADPTPAPV